LPSIIEGYEPENIGNSDETGLFCTLPKKLLCLKGEKNVWEENYAKKDGMGGCGLDWSGS
jgi:hypothetical protein